MKHIILGLLGVCAVAGVSSNTFAQNATVYLKNGQQIVFTADELDYIEFTEQAGISENENILTPTYMPDAALREYINTELAHNSGVFTVKQAAAYTKPIDLSENTTITSLKGLEFFTSLESLNISYLTSLDLTAIPVMKNLTTLKCGHTNINPVKFDFNKIYPNLKSLSVSYCVADGAWTLVNDKLVDLICDGCQLTSLDVAGCPNLQQLVCSSNNLTSINISGCDKLVELYVQYNSGLGTVNLTGIGSQLIGLNVAQTGIRDLDISGCVNLVDLELQDNYMTGRTLDFTVCPKLSHLRCENNGLAGIKVAGLANLEDLHCYSNQITELDLTGCSKLVYVNAFTNAITSVTLDGCTSLYQLNVSENQIKSLDLTPAVSTLSVFGAVSNQISELKAFDQCTALSDVNLNQNQLTELKIGNAPMLKEFQCSYNLLNKIELGNCPTLLNMDLWGNKLSRIDLTGLSMEVFTTGMFFYDENMADLEVKVWPEFDVNDKPSKWYGSGKLVHEFTAQ